uniref:Matrin-type domain-containing protein n=1 Tax=Mola mola TaxID=94237 RepID=A0A3Q3WMD0_MOLML
MAEEQATYQILDSVDEETVENQSESSRKEEISENIDSQTKNINYLTESIKPNEEEEEEPVYQVVDSLEDDQEDLMATEVSDGGKKTRSNEEASAEKDNITCSIVEETSRNVIITEEGQFEIVDDLEDLQDLCAAEGSRNESASTTDDQKEDKPTPRSQSDSETPEEENKLKSSESNTRSTLVNLDEVSEEEEDYPDDSAEEEELKKRQAATKEKKEQETKMMEEQRTRKMEKPIRRSRSRTRRAKERGEKYEEKVEELVTLDEVGADEAEEETVTDIREGEIQTLVTLDEFIEEELPAFKPNNPLGREFVVPTSGYFCNLCCLFYRRESTAKDRHCSSQTHYDNLKRGIALNKDREYNWDLG